MNEIETSITHRRYNLNTTESYSFPFFLFLILLSKFSVFHFPQLKMRGCSLDETQSQEGHMDRSVQVNDYPNFFVYIKSIFLNNSNDTLSHVFESLSNNITISRRKHKKGQEEEQAKKRTRRTQKFQRAIVGASLTDILAKRNMKPEIRKAQREQAIK